MRALKDMTAFHSQSLSNLLLQSHHVHLCRRPVYACYLSQTFLNVFLIRSTPTPAERSGLNLGNLARGHEATVQCRPPLLFALHIIDVTQQFILGATVLIEEGFNEILTQRYCTVQPERLSLSWPPTSDASQWQHAYNTFTSYEFLVFWIPLSPEN